MDLVIRLGLSRLCNIGASSDTCTYEDDVWAGNAKNDSI